MFNIFFVRPALSQVRQTMVDFNHELAEDRRHLTAPVTTPIVHFAMRGHCSHVDITAICPLSQELRLGRSLEKATDIIEEVNLLLDRNLMDLDTLQRNGGAVAGYGKTGRHQSGRNHRRQRGR
jgi:hypothetical protein